MKQRIILFCTVSLIAGLYKANAQVNLQTGATEFNLPLYNYIDPGNRIGTSVSLEYTAGNGLKVNEIPSSVGAGWMLNCGGYIERIQNGEPDDQKNNDTYTYPSFIFNSSQGLAYYNWSNSYYPNGFLYSEFSPSQYVDNGAGYTPFFGTNSYMPYVPALGPGGVLYKPNQKYMADLEQDVFSFNFNGKTGFFVIGKKDQNNNYPIRTLYDSRLKIEKIDGDLNNVNNIRTTISEFQITDEDGIKYIFKDAELSQVCSYDKKESYHADGTPITGIEWGYMYPQGTNPPPDPNIQVTRANAKNAFVKNKWYLSQIINPMTGIKIEFQYETYDVDMQGKKSCQGNVTDNRASLTMVVERIKTTCKRLKKIILSAKEEVEFVYSAAMRIDIPTDKALEKLYIKYDGVIKSKWEFEQGYFVKNTIRPLNYSFTAEDIVWARLCLNKIKKSGPLLSEPPYVFDYFLNDQYGRSAVPPLFSYYQDAWGYYNPWRFGGYYNPVNQTTSTSNTPYEPFGGNLLPKSIYQKPLYGNTSVLLYKTPGFDPSGLLKSIVNPLGGSLTYTYEGNYFQFIASDYLGAGGLRVSQVSEYDGISHVKDKIREYKYVQQDGTTTSWWGNEAHNFQRSTLLHIFKKCGDQKFPGISVTEFGSLLQNTWELINYPAWGASLSGRVALEGKVKAGIQAMIFNIIASILIDLFSSDWVDYTSTDYSSDLFSAQNPLPAQYSRVEIVNKLSTDNVGKTVFEFTSPAESNPAFQIDFPSISSPYSPKPRFAYWLYGLPRKVSFFDKYGNPVTVTENIYNPVKYFLYNPGFLSQKWRPNKMTFNCLFGPTNGSGTTEIDHDTTRPICGRIDLVTTKEYIYKSPTEYTTTIINYEYSSKNYQQSKSTANNSRGELLETYTYYPEDYTLSGITQTMATKNIVSIPVSSQNFITKPGNQKYLVSGTVSEFGVVPGGDIKAIKTYATRITDPVQASLVAFNANQLLPGTNQYAESGSFIYNANGMVQEAISEKGKSSTLYAYDNKMPVAVAINASSSNIGYTSFEDAAQGNWQFNLLYQSPDYSLTGKNAFVFPKTGAVISKSLQPSVIHTLSFWAKGNAPFVYVFYGSGTTVLSPQKTYSVSQTGWTYYEYNVAGVVVYIDNTLNNTAASPYQQYKIDELRIYPSHSTMVSMTYDPMIGKTSEADATGRVTYYEYDGLNRLKVVRDEQKNVTKSYEYNFKQ